MDAREKRKTIFTTPLGNFLVGENHEFLDEHMCCNSIASVYRFWSDDSCFLLWELENFFYTLEENFSFFLSSLLEYLVELIGE